jgi:hypothetical protein
MFLYHAQCSVVFELQYLLWSLVPGPHDLRLSIGRARCSPRRGPQEDRSEILKNTRVGQLTE